MVELPVYPMLVGFEVTSSCNLNCVYCWAKPFSQVTPPLDRLELLFRKTRNEAKPFEVALLGGEPFLRGDILEVLSLAKEIFGYYGVSSNGTYFERMTREQLLELRSLVSDRTLQVSLDSVDPAINAFGRGRTAEVLRGLDTLEEHAIPFTVSTVVHRRNVESLVDSARHLLKKYRSMKVLNFQRLMPSEALGSSFADLRLTREEYLMACDQVLQTRSEFGTEDISIHVEDDNVHERVAIDDASVKGCLAGINRAEVLVTGDVTPCSLLRRLSVGNLYRESWSEIWQRSRATHNQLELPPGSLWCEAVNGHGRSPKQLLQITKAG